MIPIRTDRAPRTPAIATRTLIILNVLVYAISHIGVRQEWFTWMDFHYKFWFLPADLNVWTMITSQFLHDPGSIFHLLGNMIFLWVFGSAVEGRLKGLGFLAFYITGGIVACFGHMVFSDAPAIGASGAVSAVTGAYLALFPRSRVLMLFFIGFIGTYAIPSAILILLYFVLDLLRALQPGYSNVAYGAHLGGSVFGFIVAMALLGFNVLPRTEFDAFFLLKQRQRRATFRRSQNRVAWEVRGEGKTDRHQQRKGPLRIGSPKKDHAEDSELAAHRQQLTKMINDHELDAACKRYLDLRHAGVELTLSPKRQMDLANLLLAGGHNAEAAEAYENLLNAFSGIDDRAQVELMLGVVYARRLHDPAKARPHLEAAQGKLHDESSKTLAQTVLNELNGNGNA